MNLMDNQYQGRDGIMDEAGNDKDQENMSRFESVINSNVKVLKAI